MHQTEILGAAPAAVAPIVRIGIRPDLGGLGARRARGVPSARLDVGQRFGFAEQLEGRAATVADRPVS